MKIAIQTLWLGVALCASAHAQVYKCPDPANNRTVYSDKPCVGAGVQLEQKRSQAEMDYDRQRAAAAYQRFQAEQRRDAAREQTQQRPIYQQPQQAAAPAGRTPECTRAKRELEFATSGVTGSKESKDAAIAAANRNVDLECLGAAKAANIRAAEAGAPKIEITNHNYGDDNKAWREAPRWCDKDGFCR